MDIDEKKTMERINLTIPTETKHKLFKLSRKLRRSMSNTVALLVEMEYRDPTLTYEIEM